MNHYNKNLDKNNANFVPLTPLSFLQRAKDIYPNYEAVIYEDRKYTWADVYKRCVKFASALEKIGIRKGDTVSFLAFNTPEIFEAHYSVPMTGAVLNALNYRLDVDNIRFILEHAQTKILITDREFSETIGKALGEMKQQPLVIDIDDPTHEGGQLLGQQTYENFIASAEAGEYSHPDDEWQAISLCYTSGTTGNPKGVVLHHRGAYLNAIGQLLVFGVNPRSRYLWTLPMFHCNGWTYTWGITAAAGTHICLRKVDPALIFSLIKEHRVTHMCGAPIVLTMLIHAPENAKLRFEQTVEVATGGAAPPSQVIRNMEQMGFRVTHLYGLTETYGPATVCAWQTDWDQLDEDGKTRKMARQGGAYHTLEDIMVANPETMEAVPQDGETMGELMIRGNTVMKGYLKNPNASEEAFRGGWFHTGDLGVRHPDGYIEVKDRSKDVIISGGENISSLEIEEVLYKHPEIMEAAVVARKDDKWGETPCAFVTLKPGSEHVDEETLIHWCRERMAHFKSPKTVIFGELPKTSTGKIQKYTLRERANQH